MSNSCEKERKAYLEALERYGNSSSYLQSFISIEPISFGRRKEPIQFNEYDKAIKEHKSADEEYMEKMDAYMKCRKKLDE
jgi:hypothetical protein